MIPLETIHLETERESFLLYFIQFYIHSFQFFQMKYAFRIQR